MKKYKLLSIILVLSILTSCNDFLELTPVDEIGSNGFYENAEEVNAGVIAIYDGMQKMVQAEYALTEMRSDNTKTKNSEGTWAQFEDMNVEATNATVADYWSSNYNVIFRANTILENLDVVTDATEKSQYEGEAKFARAMCHFNLVRAFGDVPLITTVVGVGAEEHYSRVESSKVYESIVSDLTDAVSMLPSRHNIAEGRATSGAANTLLAKVYLTQKNYQEANTALNAVINSGDYALEANYNDVFYNELNDEIIFAIQFIDDNTEDSQIFSYNFTWKGRASGLNYPTEDLMTAVDTVNDLRSSTLFYFEIQSGSSGRNECGKFRSSAANEELSGNDWIILRYSDVLLMQAEAILAGANSTSDSKALANVNAIRSRAGLANLTILTKADLLYERRVELAFENQRLYDLIRFDEADNILEAFSTTAEAAFNYSSTALLLPIPQREINLYDGLTQNSGY